MNWYLIIKFLHILAVTITMGGMFARQLVRGLAKKSGDIKVAASLTQVAIRIDRTMVIPWSNIILLMGIVLAVMQKMADPWVLAGLVPKLAFGLKHSVDHHVSIDSCGIYSSQQKS